jgi:hypothetical protein
VVDYQQQVICSGSEITIDSSFESLQVTFSVVVIETGPSSFIESIGVRSPGFLETKIDELS